MQNPSVRIESRLMSRRSRGWTEQMKIKPAMPINALCREADVDVRDPWDENDDGDDDDPGRLE